MKFKNFFMVLFLIFSFFLLLSNPNVLAVEGSNSIQYTEQGKHHMVCISHKSMMRLKVGAEQKEVTQGIPFVNICQIRITPTQLFYTLIIWDLPEMYIEVSEPEMQAMIIAAEHGNGITCSTVFQNGSWKIRSVCPQ